MSNKRLLIGDNQARCAKCDGQGRIYDGSSTGFVMMCNYCRGSGVVACQPNQEVVSNHVQ